MATVKNAPHIASITGKLGNLNFSQRKGGTTLRRTPTSRKACKSTGQHQGKALLGSASKTWPLLAEGQKNAWESYALGLKSVMPSTDTQRKGGTGALTLIKPSWGTMSGFNAFIRNALLAGAAGYQSPVLDAPINIAPPLGVTNLSGIADPGFSLITLSWTNPIPNPEDSATVIYISGVKNKLPVQIARVMSWPNDGSTIQGITGTCGSPISLDGQDEVYRIQAIRISSSGQPSVPSNTIELPYAGAGH